MSIQFGDILQHNNLLYPIVDINDVKGGLRSIATFSSPALVSEFTSIPEKYRSGYSLLLETSTGTIYYLAGVDPTNVSHWSPVGIGGNGYGVTNTIPKWTSSSILGNSNITDNGDTITINGNLMVIGTTSTVSTENLLVKDPIILLAGSQSGTPIYDAGLFVNRGSSDTQAFIWDESETEFKFITTTSGATVSGDVTIGTYSNVRTGVLSVGTGTSSDSRFLVSSSGGTVSLVVDEYGGIYNISRGIQNTLFGYGSQQVNVGGGSISINSINSGDFNYDDGEYENIEMTLYSGPAPSTYPIVNIEVILGEVVSVTIISPGTGFISDTTRLTANIPGGTGFYVTIDFLNILNTSIGASSLYSNLSGSSNTSLGAYSLYSNINGSNNTAIGTNTLYSNTGSQNIAIGASSLYSNSSGSINTAIGFQSLYNNTNGGFNTSIGDYTLYNNTTSNFNIAIGAESLYNNTTNVFTFSTLTPGSGYLPGTYSNVQLIYATGSTAITYPNATIIVGTGGTVSSVTIGDNKGIGFKNITTVMTANNLELGGTGSGFTIKVGAILNGQQNIAIGWRSLYNNTTGYNNIALGWQSAFNNTTGYQNTILGYQSLYNNTTGNQNTAIGYNSLFDNTTGVNNTGIGYRVLFNNTTGNQNTGIGNDTLYNSTTASNSVAVGYSALYKNNTGNYNTAIGSESLRSNTTRVITLAPTFSPGTGYTPGTYTGIVLFGISGSFYFPGNSTADYPQVTMVVGAGGTVSSVTLTNQGSVIPDTTVVFGIQTGPQLYQLPPGGFGFSITIGTIAIAGSDNTALGYSALNSNLSGSRNTGLGVNAGISIQDTTDSIYIGYSANSFLPAQINEIVIGATAMGNGSNTVTLGNDSIVTTYLKGNIQLPTVPTTSGGSYSILTRNDVTGEVEKIVVTPYVVYTALITQSGTASPTVTILENTIGSIDWTRDSTGAYKGTSLNLVPPFTNDKTIAFISGSRNSYSIPVFYDITRFSDDEIAIYTYQSGTNTDGMLSDTSIEIRVYN